MSLNKCILIGNVTRDIELVYTKSGTAVAKFSLAMSRVYTDGAGNKVEESTFVDVTAWDKGAEFANKHLKKGAEICVEGRLKQDKWQDKETGQNRYKLYVVADMLTPTFGTWKDKPSDAGERTKAPPKPTKAPPTGTRPTGAPKPPAAEEPDLENPANWQADPLAPELDDDDLPY